MKKRSSVLLCLLALGTAAAHADEIRSVPSGMNRQIDFLASINPDCSSIGLATVRLIEGPSHGVLTTDKGRDYRPFAAPNPRHACNKRRLPGVKVFYQSETGFAGVDRVRILIIAASGTEREARYEIRVR